IGGLVGLLTDLNFGPSTVTDSYATGSVTAAPGVAGGLVGQMAIENGGTMVQGSYATGSVQGNVAGGIAGEVSENQFLRSAGFPAHIVDSYSWSAVAGDLLIGGLIGHGIYPTVLRSYHAKGTVQSAAVGGLVGK